MVRWQEIEARRLRAAGAMWLAPSWLAAGLAAAQEIQDPLIQGDSAEPGASDSLFFKRLLFIGADASDRNLDIVSLSVFYNF